MIGLDLDVPPEIRPPLAPIGRGACLLPWWLVADAAMDSLCAYLVVPEMKP